MPALYNGANDSLKKPRNFQQQIHTRHEQGYQRVTANNLHHA